MSGTTAAAAAEHFRLQAQGQRSLARGGDLFRGRHAALAAVRNWLTAIETPGRPLVLTGQPGAGKSAVIARTILHLQNDAVGPGLAFLGRGSTHFELLTAVADLTGVDRANSTYDLLTALKERGDGPWMVVIDALDEASTPRDRREMSNLLTELATLPALRVVIATRALTPGAAESRYHHSALLPSLGVSSPDSPSLVDLDADQFFESAGVSDYAAALLVQSGAEHHAGQAWAHYRSNTPLRNRVASIISARAGRNYLVAAMAADRLSTQPDAVNPDHPAFDPATIPASVGEALDKSLDVLEDRRRTRVRGLLTALAYARGAGIDDQMWLAFASALGYSVGIEDLDELYDTPAADYLLQITPSDNGAPVTRLFHQALTDDLIQRRRHRIGDERALLDVLLPPSHRGWDQASAYARSHAGDHAAACKQLPTLLQDPHYLAVANLTRLLPILPAQPDLQEAPIVSVLRQIGVEANPLPPLRRNRLLALTASRNGLHELNLQLATAWRNGLVPRWAQPLGAPHQVIMTDTAVWAVAVGRAGERDIIVSGGEDQAVRIWDAVTGEPVGSPLTGHTDTVWAVAAGRAGDRDIIVSGSGDETVRIWDAATGEPVGSPLTGHTDTVWAVAAGRAGDRDIIISASGDETVRVWDAATGEPVGSPLTGREPVVSVAVGRVNDFDIIVFGSIVGAREPVLDSWHSVRESLHADIGRAGDRQLIFPRMVDGTMWVWEGSTDQDAAGWTVGQFLGGVWAVAVARVGDRDVIISGSGDKTVQVWDAATREPVGTPLTGHTNTVWAVTVGRVGDRDVIVSGSRDDTVRIWDAATREPVGTPLTGHHSGVPAVAVGRTSGRDIIVSGSIDETIRIWETVTGQPVGHLATSHTQTVESMAVGRAGNRDVVVSCCRDESVHVWDALTGKPIDTLHGHILDVLSVAVGRTGDRDIIVSGSADRSVRIWDATTGQPIGDPIGAPNPYGRHALLDHPYHNGVVKAVAVGRVGDRDVIVSGSWDATLRVWDAATHDPIGTPLQVPEKYWVTAVAVGRADNRDIIVSGGGDATVRVWDAATRELIGNPLTGHTDAVLAVAVGRAGDRDVIISSGEDKTVRIWDAVTGRLIDSLLGHSAAVTAVAMGRAGDRDIIISGSGDGTVRIWDAAGTLMDIVDQGHSVNAVALSTDGTVYIAADVAICAYTPPNQKA